MNKENRIPKTKDECFAILDEMLSVEDKQSIVEMEDTIDLHFGLGMWIRNNWIYPQSQEEVEKLLRQFDDSGDEDMPLFIHPDDYSSTILDAYQEYLKSKK
jgi:hypothetical protein